MKKQIFGLSILGALVLLGAGCTASPTANVSTAGWKTEHTLNTEYGFEYNLQYPADWKIDQADDHSVVIATTASVNDSDSSFTVTTLATGGAAKNAAEIEAYTKTQMEKNFPASTILESAMTVGGHTWQVLELRRVLLSARGVGQKKNPNADLVSGDAIYYFTDNAPYVTRIALSLSDKEKNTLRPIYDEMLKRFVLIPAVGPKQ